MGFTMDSFLPPLVFVCGYVVAKQGGSLRLKEQVVSRERSVGLSLGFLPLLLASLLLGSFSTQLVLQDAFVDVSSFAL